MRVREKEAQHFAGRIGSPRVGERPRGATAGPGVAGAVHQPVFGDCAAAAVLMCQAGVTRPLRRHALLDARAACGGVGRGAAAARGPLLALGVVAAAWCRIALGRWWSDGSPCSRNAHAQKVLAWDKSASRRARGWAGENVARSRGQPWPLPWRQVVEIRQPSMGIVEVAMTTPYYLDTAPVGRARALLPIDGRPLTVDGVRLCI